jgi:hypothetical protein
LLSLKGPDRCFDASGVPSHNGATELEAEYTKNRTLRDPVMKLRLLVRALRFSVLAFAVLWVGPWHFAQSAGTAVAPVAKSADV